MPETYSREGSFSLKKEASPNVAVTPDTFIPINDEGISVDYSPTQSKPISTNRAENQRAIKKAIPAPTGPINVNVEPKTFGHFLNGVFGGLTSGNYVTVSSVVGTFDLTNVVTFVGSGATATPLFIGDGFIIFGTITGSPVNTDTLLQAVSGATADVDIVDTSVFGHVAQMPADITDTYSCQRNLVDRAIRWTGVRFHGIDAFAQSDNIITAGIASMAQAEFREGVVGSAVTSGAGSKVIPVSQTQGLVAGDTIKVWRPSTKAFLDFVSTGVKTHTIDSVVPGVSVTVTNLDTSLAADDLIVLAPQTASYTIEEEYAWIGCSQMQLGDDQDNLADFDAQDYTMVVNSEFEERHAATGTNIADRFPSDLLQMGFTASGTFTLHNEDEFFYRQLIAINEQAIQMTTTGNQIGSTGINFLLQVRYSKVVFDAYDTQLSADDIVQEEVPFTSYYDDVNAYSVQVLLVNDITSY